MILYLSSQKFGDNYSFFKELISKNSNKILLIANALDYKDTSTVSNIIHEDKHLLSHIGFDVTIVDLKDYFEKHEELKKICRKFNNICVIGGNVFILREAMKYSGFDKYLKEISKKDNYLYIGYSAGGCVLSQNLDIYKKVDDPVDFYNKGKIIYDGIGLIDYQFIPHYKSNYHKAYLIDEIVDTCKKENIKYKALKDGEYVSEKIGVNI